MFDSLTERQLEVFYFIRRFILDNDRPPTIREISAAFGFRSPNGTVCHLTALQRKWYIRRTNTPEDAGHPTRALYVPAVPELVVEAVSGGRRRAMTTGPVLFSDAKYVQWLFEQLAEMGVVVHGASVPRHLHDTGSEKAPRS